MKRIAVIVLLLLFCCGCSATKTEEAPSELWVVTEKGRDYGLRELVERKAEAFSGNHDGFPVRVEVLPQSGSERELRLEQLRTEIMSGGGPDVFVLPCGWFQPDELFLNVQQSMANGFFADFSDLYAADSELHTEELLSEVMDAGTYDGGRYLLPLGYDLPVSYVDTNALKAAGLTPEQLDTDIVSLLALLENAGAPVVRDYWFFEHFTMNFLPTAMDFEEKTVSVDSGDVAAVLEAARTGAELPFAIPSFGSYIMQGDYWADGSTCVMLGSLAALLENGMISGAEDTELSVIPIRGLDGGVHPSITSYGAISANSKNRELAYAFLRELVTDTVQWENERWYGLGYSEMSKSDMLFGGWPVRNRCFDQLRKNRWALIEKGKFEDKRAVNQRKKALGAARASEDILGILELSLDAPRFPYTWETDCIEEAMFSDVPISELAEELTEKLTWMMAEG